MSVHTKQTRGVVPCSAPRFRATTYMDVARLLREASPRQSPRPSLHWTTPTQTDVPGAFACPVRTRARSRDMRLLIQICRIFSGFEKSLRTCEAPRLTRAYMPSTQDALENTTGSASLQLTRGVAPCLVLRSCTMTRCTKLASSAASAKTATLTRDYEFQIFACQNTKFNAFCFCGQHMAAEAEDIEFSILARET